MAVPYITNIASFHRQRQIFPFGRESARGAGIHLGVVDFVIGNHDVIFIVAVAVHIGKGYTVEVFNFSKVKFEEVIRNI